MLTIDVITLFPKMFEAGPLQESMLKIAQEKEKLNVVVHNLRDYTHDKHKTCDDTPFGGGPGMVMKPEPLFEAVTDIKKNRPNTKVILLTPQGKTFSQKMAKEMSLEKEITLICGHYEGVDERFRESLVDEEISIGDYVLTGGELPAMCIIDAVTRLIPGVLGNDESIHFESFQKALLDHPHYTRPRVYKGMQVPEVLCSGDHQKIKEWREQQALKRTKASRPDLLHG